ncbi:plasmid stablization protein ParB [Streptomyces purpurogeneiscleroticus]|nr:plasmid stablization protein ParB [Streptomyces purpurogeneiscleroticus]
MNNSTRRSLSFGFEPETIFVPIAALTPVKTLRASVKASSKYAQIAQSVREIGLVEPPVVARDRAVPDRYLLLDGHMRIEVLKEQGHTEVECLVSTDDEAFTYNRYINRPSPVQERAMIVRAIERGVPEGRIAAAMSLDVVSVQRRVKLLDGICPEVVAQLSDRHCPMAVFDILRKMKPLKQMQTADVMVNHNNFCVAFAAGMLSTASETELVKGAKIKPKGISAVAMAQMERELANMQAAIGSVEASFSQDNLHLMVAKGYLAKLLANHRVRRFLESRYPAYLEQFVAISDITSTLSVDAVA